MSKNFAPFLSFGHRTYNYISILLFAHVVRNSLVTIIHLNNYQLRIIALKVLTLAVQTMIKINIKLQFIGI